MTPPRDRALQYDRTPCLCGCPAPVLHGRRYASRSCVRRPRQALPPKSSPTVCSRPARTRTAVTGSSWWIGLDRGRLNATAHALFPGSRIDRPIVTSPDGVG